MAFGQQQIFPIDLNNSAAVGISLPFNGPAVFKSNYQTKDSIKYNLINFVILAVLIQITHDIVFYLFSKSVKRGKSKILDIFKDYGKEKGFGAIMADSLMIISSILIASYLKGKTLNSNIIILIFSIYLVPYMIYTV